MKVHHTLSLFVLFHVDPILGKEPKESFSLGTKFLVVAASQSHYPLGTATPLGCHRQPER